VKKERKKGKINFRPGIEPGTQRLGVQYTRHQAITKDKVYMTFNGTLDEVNGVAHVRRVHAIHASGPLAHAQKR